LQQTLLFWLSLRWLRESQQNAGVAESFPEICFAGLSGEEVLKVPHHTIKSECCVARRSNWEPIEKWSCQDPRFPSHYPITCAAMPPDVGKVSDFRTRTVWRAPPIRGHSPQFTQGYLRKVSAFPLIQRQGRRDACLTPIQEYWL